MLEVISFGPMGYGDELARGLGLTLALAAASFAVALVVGIALGPIAAKRKCRFCRWLWSGLATVFMGIPELLIILFVYYNLPFIVSGVFGVSLDIGPFTAGVIALGATIGIYSAEVVRGAILNIPQGQIEAGQALGLRKLHLWRLVLLPQVIRLALPGLSNNAILTLKSTALVSLIGLRDFVGMANIAARNTFEPFLFFFVIGIVYIFLGWAVRLISKFLERQYDFDSRRGGVAP